MRRCLHSHLYFNIDCLETWNGAFALQMVEREALDLIVFGDDVPDMNGLEFLHYLNASFDKPQAPVIEILDSGAMRTGIQAMKMGAHDYLLKDFDGQHYELLPILVSRVYAEQQTMTMLRQTAGVQQTVCENIPSVIYQLSLQDGMHDVRISPQIAQLGISPEQWGSDAELHHQMCHEEDRSLVRRALEQSYLTGELFQCEYRIKTLAGGVRWFHDQAKVVMDKYGRPLLLQGVMTDISCIKSLESELMQYRHMFETLLRQRTERLDRRVAILESCNETLSVNFEKMHQMYLDLLIKSHAAESSVAGG